GLGGEDACTPRIQHPDTQGLGRPRLRRLGSDHRAPGAHQHVKRRGPGKGRARRRCAATRDELREGKMDRKRMESAADLATSIGTFYVKAFTQPMTALGGSLAASHEMLKSLIGQSEIEPDKSDKRFKDPVWTSNPGY